MKTKGLEIGIRGAYVVSVLFVVRVLRGVYGLVWCAPRPWYLMFSLVSAPCLPRIPVRVGQDAVTLCLW